MKHRENKTVRDLQSYLFKYNESKFTQYRAFRDVKKKLIYSIFYNTCSQNITAKKIKAVPQNEVIDWKQDDQDF